MNDEVLVKAEGVSKKFCRDLKRSLWYGVKDIGAELMGIQQNGQLRKKEFWAVNDVSFELKRGECLGLIGHNGAGKSTLLKMLNGLIKPDKGTITMKGRIGALIELGAGFNPILTGRENIYNNGAVLGFSKKEIDKKFDAIVGFAEIDEFIDTPVQNYSSGMKVRLGFAVAAQMEPDVLIIDEVLAVGDLGFILKCFNLMDKIIKKAAVVFVSHNMPQISRIASKICYLGKGNSVYCGSDVSQGINCYYDRFESKIAQMNYKSEYGELVKLKVIQNEKVYDINSRNSFDVGSLSDLSFEASFKVDKKFRHPTIGFILFDQNQKGLASFWSNRDGVEIINKSGELMVIFRFENINLNVGFYSLSIAVMGDQLQIPILRAQSVIRIRIKNGYVDWNPLFVNGHLNIVSQ